MREKTILLTAIFLLLGANLFSQPILEIVEPSFVFGKVPQHSTVAHSFWFKSTGSDTLRITEIKTGCVCTLMPLEQDFIAPGDSMEVGVYWEFKNRLHNSNKAPYIFTNAKEDPYRVYLNAWVVKRADSLRPLSASPYKYEFSKYGEKDITEIAFKLINNTKEDMTVKIASTLPKECEITFPENIKSKSSADGIIKVKSEYLDKEFMSSITFDVSNIKEGRITIPVRRHIYK